MKKIIAIMLSMMFVAGLTACGGLGSQTISFQGITMEIPGNWKPEKSTLSDTYAIYEKKNKTGHDYKLRLTDTFDLLGTYEGDMDRAGAFLKEITEDDASYVDVSDPVAGKFAGKYDMHTIDCTLKMINPMADNAEASYPCKLVRIYMGDHDVELEFSAVNGDFEAFNTAVAEASCK